MGAFELLATVVTSNAVVGLIQYLLTRHFNKKDMTQKTLAAVTYSTLADKLERALDRDMPPRNSAAILRYYTIAIKIMAGTGTWILG